MQNKLTIAMADKMKACWVGVAVELDKFLATITRGAPWDAATVGVVQSKTAEFRKHGLADSKTTGLSSIDTEPNVNKQDAWLEKMGNHAECLAKGLLTLASGPLVFGDAALEGLAELLTANLGKDGDLDELLEKGFREDSFGHLPLPCAPD